MFYFQKVKKPFDPWGGGYWGPWLGYQFWLWSGELSSGYSPKSYLKCKILLLFFFTLSIVKLYK